MTLSPTARLSGLGNLTWSNPLLPARKTTPAIRRQTDASIRAGQNAIRRLSQAYARYNNLSLNQRQSDAGSQIAARLSLATRQVNEFAKQVGVGVQRARTAGYLSKDNRLLVGPPPQDLSGLGVVPVVAVAVVAGLTAFAIAALTYFYFEEECKNIWNAVASLLYTLNDLIRFWTMLPPADPLPRTPSGRGAVNNAIAGGMGLIGFGIAAWIAVTFLKTRRRAN